MLQNKKVKSKTLTPIIALIFFLFIISPSSIFAANQCNSPSYTTTLSSSNTNYTSTDSVYWVGNSYNYHTYYIDVQTPGTVTINISGGHAGFTYANDYCPDYSNTYHTTKTFHTTSDFNLYVDAMQQQYNASYTLTIAFTPDNPTPGSGTDDICYNDLQLSGFCMGSGFCSGGLNCKKTYPLQINSSINNVKIYYNETGMGGSFGNSCGVNPSGTCQTTDNINMGPFGFFGQATEFDLGNVDQNTSDPDIWTQNTMGMSCFSGDRLYVTYTKDGVTYKKKLKKCSQIQNSDDKFREFEIRNPENTRNIKGNVKFIGNTVLKYNYNNRWHYTNTDLYLNYIDTDSNSNTYNSSKAQLDIPANSTVVWVGLYTQGYLKGTTSVDGIYQILNEPVYLTAPSIGTISITPDVIDYAINKDSRSVYGYAYDTYTEIKNLEGKKASEVNGWITAANIKCYEGKDNSGLGNFGAWTLVVVYKNQNEKLKNISVFDGYKKVADQAGYRTVNVPVSGFLTPLHGDINSTLSLFVGEGDKYITGDKLYVNNIGINTTNAFDSSISGVTRDPSIINNQGIDIQNHNISNIIDNGDTGANITLTSDGDMYFPSVVAFATDLYEPRVCYYINSIKDDSNNTILKDGQVVDGAKIDPTKEYRFSLWIANMPKNPNDNIENARNVQTDISAPDFNYTSNSIQIKNIGEGDYSNKTDQARDDVIEYNNSSKTFTWRLGIGADATQGGEIAVANSFDDNSSKAFIKFRGKFSNIGNDQTSIDISSFYNFKASFQTDSITITPENALPIDACINMDTVVNIYKAPPGNFNVVHNNFIGTIDPLSQTDPKNALYTQIVNRPFNVKILALDTDNTTLKPYNGDINVTIITTPHYTGNITHDKLACKNAIINSSFVFTPVHFSNIESVSQNFTYASANKNISFGIVYDNGSTPGYICSRDSFAVRPDRFDISINGTASHKAGKDYNITFEALDGNITNLQIAQNYNEPVGNSFKVDINETKAGCSTGNFAPSLKTGWSFSDGNYTTSSNYNEVGIVNIKVEEINGSEFAFVDHNDTNDSQRLIEPYDKNISFTPDHFDVNATLTNGGQNFTYISSDLNMSATLDINITAKATDNNTTTNYNSACYAQTTDYNISYTALNITPASSLTRILYKETNTSIDGNNSINSDINLTNMPKSIFSTDNNGTGSIHVKINFDRNKSRVVNPFDLNITDINVSDANNTIGNQNLDKNTTFYYGRVHAPDYRFEGNNGTATIYYEVYSDQNKTTRNSFGINGSESVDSIDWYINTLDNNLSEGNVTEYSSVGSVRFENNTSGTTNSANLANLANGTETIDVTASKLPYKDKIDMNSSSWLIYNPTDFLVEFFDANDNWAGQGIQGKTVDLNISKVQNQRLDW